MASSVVSVFEGTIAKVVALATISPIITGMGGNAGTQTLTIVVRGLSLGELDKENARKCGNDHVTNHGESSYNTKPWITSKEPSPY